MQVVPSLQPQLQFGSASSLCPGLLRLLDDGNWCLNRGQVPRSLFLMDTFASLISNHRNNLYSWANIAPLLLSWHLQNEIFIVQAIPRSLSLLVGRKRTQATIGPALSMRYAIHSVSVIISSRVSVTIAFLAIHYIDVYPSFVWLVSIKRKFISVGIRKKALALFKRIVRAGFL